MFKELYDKSLKLASHKSSNFFLAIISDLSTEYTLLASPISESWDEGIGKFGDNPATLEGMSWEYRNQYVQNGTSQSWSTPGCTVYLDHSSAATASGTSTCLIVPFLPSKK